MQQSVFKSQQAFKAMASKQWFLIPKPRAIHMGSRSTLMNRSSQGNVSGYFSTRIREVVYARSIFVQGFHNRIPKGGFFFAGSLAPDTTKEDVERDLAAEIAANMTEVAEIENAEKEEARARAAKSELLKQGLAQRILREQPNIQFLSSDKAKQVNDMPSSVPDQTEDKEEFLRTEYYKNFHKGDYHSKYFAAAAKK